MPSILYTNKETHQSDVYSFASVEEIVLFMAVFCMICTLKTKRKKYSATYDIQPFSIQ